jgi:outer membrane cobalamin receptor
MVMGLSRTAFAAGASDLEAVLAEPVVSGASDNPEDDSVAPATITTITADDLRRYGIQTLDQAINFLSLGMITQDNMDGAEIGSRGVLLTGDYGNHVLLLLNGHAMNEQWDGTAYYGRGTAIPFELIDHIEVIVGPGSVLYGTNAMLGVINVVTKAAKDFKGFHVVGEMDFGGNNNVKDFAATTYRVGVGVGTEFQLAGKHAEITGMVEYFQRNGPSFWFSSENYGTDFVTGNGKCFDKLKPDGTCAGTPGFWPPVDPSKGGAYADQSYYAQVPSGYLRMIWGDWELDVRAALYKRSFPYEFGLWNNPLDGDHGGSFEVDRWVSGDLKNRWQISPIAQLRTRIYGDTYDYFENLPSYAPEDCLTGQNGCLYTLRGAAVWGGIEEQLVLDYLKDNRLTTLVGIDERVRFRGQRTDSVDIATNANPGSVTAFGKIDNVFAAYLQQTASPWKWLGMNAGARLDVYEGFGAQVSPRAAISVKPWDKGTLKAIYSEAFRAPTAYEQLDTDGVTHIANLGLKPETVRSVEGSFEQRFGQNRIMAGGFWSKWQNLINYHDLTQAELDDAIAKGLLPAGSNAGTQYQNVDSLSNWGFNARFEGSALNRDLRYALNVTGAWTQKDAHVDPLNPIDNTPAQLLTVAPQVFGNARLSYDLPGDWPVLGVAASLIGKRPADKAFNTSSDGTTTTTWAPTPWAPAQLDFRFTISGPVPKLKGLSYRLIADYAVSSRGPYVVGPNTTPYPGNNVAQLIPVDQFRATVGLQYDIR